MGAVGLGQFIEEIGWEKGKELDIKASLAPTAWEAALAELAAYGAADDVSNSKDEG